MELLIAILFIVILVLIIQQKNAYAKHTEQVHGQISELYELIKKLKLPTPTVPEKPVAKVEEVVQPKPVTPKPSEQPYEKQLEETLFVMPEKPGEKRPPVEERIEKVITTPVQEQKPAPPVPPRPVTPPPPPKPGFFERNPDLEKFIGENLVSKIGIAILVLAIGFFVKYAIDNDWIGHAGRVGIGILCGSILIGIAHKLQKKYQAFSSVLVGGGLAIFYFTITLAYHEYQLFSQVTTFIIMLVVTAFAVLLSLLYDRQELAIISLVGGFATPFMASSGSGSYISLFIYLIILNSGLLVIAYKKAWRLLNLLAFIFTVILFASWLFLLPSDDYVVYRNGLSFATVFYILFLAINVAHNIRVNKRFIASDFGILLANTCLYFSVGLYLINQMEVTDYRGLFTAALGIFNMGLSYVLFRNKKVDANILYLLIGITLTFVSLTAPIQLKGNHITLFWSCEAVLLYWLYRKSGIRLMLITSVCVGIAMLLSLGMDWMNVYGSGIEHLAIVANKGFITTIVAAAACFVLGRMYLTKNADGVSVGSNFSATIHTVVGMILLYLSGAFETAFQFSTRYQSDIVGVFYWGLYTMAFVAIVGLVAQKIAILRNPVTISVLYSITLIVYLLLYYNTYELQYEIQQKKVDARHFIVHWLSAILFIWIFVRLVQLLRKRADLLKNYPGLSWALSLLVIVFLSVEGSLLSNQLFYGADNSVDDIQRVYIKTGLPILWGLSSFVLMWLGMKNKNRSLRIISLVLFGITLLKLFIFDIRNIPVAGKIAAFFSLGVLLLIVSFMYQRLKKIIIEDEKASRTE